MLSAASLNTKYQQVYCPAASEQWEGGRRQSCRFAYPGSRSSICKTHKIALTLIPDLHAHEGDVGGTYAPWKARREVLNFFEMETIIDLVSHLFSRQEISEVY